MKPFLVRGAAAGVAGALASVLVLLLLGERSITEAIALEEARAVPDAEAHAELFTREAQVAGGALGMLLVGVAMGLVFGVVFAATRHRLGGGGDWRRARRLGVAAFVAVPLVPFLKYPANPPAVGDPDTVGARTLAYVCLLAVSVLAVVLAGAVADRLRRWGVAEPLAQTGAGALWAVAVGVAYLALPAAAPAGEIPADLLWSFRVASLGGQAAFWTVAATTFALLCARADGRVTVPANAVAAPPGSAPTAT